MKRTFWSESRVKRISTATLLALVISVAITGFSDREARSLLLRGDFPAFYSAGVIVSRGLSHRLYDPVLQQQVENSFWPSLEKEYYAYAYPPYVAWLLSPLAHLGPFPAKALYTVIMLLFLATAVYLSTRIVPSLRDSFLPAFVLFLSFAPVFTAVIGGQNVALSMLLYVAAIYALDRWQTKGELLAGILLGLLLFKPHYGLCIAFFLLLSGSFRVILGMALPALGYFALGILTSGLSWPVSWFHAVCAFAEQDFLANQHQMVSFTGVFRALGSICGPCPSTLLYFLALLCSIAVVLLTGVRFWRISRTSATQGFGSPLIPALLLLAPTIVLVSPHTLFYDLGICLIPLAMLCPLDTDRRMNTALAIWVIILLLGLAKAHLPIQPMALFGVFAYALVFIETRSTSS